jgi:hypothetical protein
MENKTYLFYTDPGHGWLKVPRADLGDLGIESQITRCSYERGDFVYLEEDCDVATFFTAFNEKFGHYPKNKEGSHTNRQSRIRNYDSFVPRF